jgi:hypothetical protein
VFIQQCAQIAPGVYGCDYDHTHSVTLDDSGEGTVKTTVRRVFEAKDSDGELIGEVDCATVERGFSLSVGNFAGATNAAIRPGRLAAPPAGGRPPALPRPHPWRPGRPDAQEPGTGWSSAGGPYAFPAGSESGPGASRFLIVS